MDAPPRTAEAVPPTVPGASAANGRANGDDAAAGREVWVVPVVLRRGVPVGHAVLRRVLPDGGRAWDIVRGTDAPPLQLTGGERERRPQKTACMALTHALLTVAAPRSVDVLARATLRSTNASVYAVGVELEAVEAWACAARAVASRHGPAALDGTHAVPHHVLPFDDVRIVLGRRGGRRGARHDAADAADAAGDDRGADAAAGDAPPADEAPRRGGPPIPLRRGLPPSATPAARAAMAWAESAPADRRHH